MKGSIPVIFLILFASLVFAVDFVPQGDINGRNRRVIKNFTNISGINGTFDTIYLSGTTLISDNTTWNETYGYSLFLNRSSETDYTTTFNSSYDAKVTDNQTWNETRGNGLYLNRTNENLYTTTYNSSYDAKVTDNQTWNQTLADGLYVDVAGDTMTGSLQIRYDEAILRINSTGSSNSAGITIQDSDSGIPWLLFELTTGRFSFTKGSFQPLVLENDTLLINKSGSEVAGSAFEIGGTGYQGTNEICDQSNNCLYENLTLNEISTNLLNWSEDKADYWNTSVPFNFDVNVSYIDNFDINCPSGYYQSGLNASNESIACRLNLGNVTWNETLADSLYAPISTVTDNQTWNETRGNSIYLSNTGDDATGKYNFTSGNVSFADLLFVDNTDSNIGIGTVTPSAKLDILQTNAARGIFVEMNNDSASANIKLTHTSEGADTNYILLIAGGDTNRRTAYFDRDLNSTVTNTPVIEMVQNNPSDNQDTLKLRQDGSGNIQSWYINSTEKAHLNISGGLQLDGSISKGSGTFTIDHPLDPTNKLLQHSFVESPEMRNMYYGQSVTNNAKKAIIILPDWFEALNGKNKEEYNYQFTGIGKLCNFYVSSEIENNKFEVTSDLSNCKFSWTVSAIRHDAFAENNRVQVEVNKQPADLDIKYELKNSTKIVGNEKIITTYKVPIMPLVSSRRKGTCIHEESCNGIASDKIINYPKEPKKVFIKQEKEVLTNGS